MRPVSLSRFREPIHALTDLVGAGIPGTIGGAVVMNAGWHEYEIGASIESFDRYLKAGINMGLGTDTFPKDIISEMRYAALVSRLVEKSFIAGHPRDVFNAATLGGAKLLGRDDVGRLEKGSKADIVVVDLQDTAFGAVRLVFPC